MRVPIWACEKVRVGVRGDLPPVFVVSIYFPFFFFFVVVFVRFGCGIPVFVQA